jgi:membrane-associated protease RseP (regulator of RpoE activity)
VSDDTDGVPGGTDPAPQAEEPTAQTSPSEPSPADASAGDATGEDTTRELEAEPAPEPASAEPVTAASPVEPAPVAAAAPPARGGVFVPTWVAVLVAVLLIGGIGFLVGYAIADDNDSDTSTAASSQTLPPNQLPNRGALPNVPGAPNGNNGQTAADTAFLGVSVESVDDNGGARVTDVRAGSPAADAGLKTGDVITKVDNTTIETDADLIRAIRSHDPDDKVTITYTRDGNSAQAEVTLGNRSDATRSSLPS